MQGRIEDVGVEGRTRSLRAAPAVEGETSVRGAYRALYRWIALTDVLSVAAALLVGYWARFGWLEMPSGTFALLLLASPIAILCLYAGFHLYDAYRYAPAEEFRRIIFAVSMGVGSILVVSFWSKADYSRLWLAIAWATALFAALASRRLWHGYIHRQRVQGRLSFPTVVVGTNAEAQHLARLMQLPSFGFRAIAMVSTDLAPGIPAGDVPVMGTVADLRDVIRDVGAECVFVAASALSAFEMGYVAKAVRLEGVEVRVTATLPEVLSSRVAVQSLGGVTALSLRPARLTGTQVVIKRAFDIAVAGLGLLLVSPVLATIALAVKLTSPGPVLFRQKRVGHRGRPFTMLKFRTMQVGADRMVDELREQHGVEGLMFKLKDDPRVTAVGRFLRKVSLDELPQLLNVVIGDMSLVGPRPPLPEEVTRYEDWQFDRLEVPPGISGLWQVSGRSDLSFEDCVRLDLFYIENWSLAYDLYILAKTIPVLVSKRGAY
ncbi:MAG: sugar transferase [Actinomycetota bacterium]